MSKGPVIANKCAPPGRGKPPIVELLRILEQRYDLGALQLRGRLEGGYANDVYLIEAAGEPYVLRVKHPPVHPESIAWEHQLLERVALEIVPTPIRAKDDSTFFVDRGLAVSVLPYVPGRPATPTDGPAVAAALGRFHAAASAVDFEQRPTFRPLAQITWPAARLPSHLAHCLPRLENARRWAIAWTQGAAAPTAPIHGDFFPGNVLVDGGRVTALLDWEEARVDWPAIDVAAGVWHFAVEDGRRGDRFLAAYADAGGFPPDRAVLTPLVRVKRVLEVLRAPTDRHVDWDYQCENLAAIERLPET
jgi:Ser/Thr protein kinase RdoA (MazF antagonist)